METSQWKVQVIEVRCLSSPIRITRVYARILCRNEKKLDSCAMVIKRPGRRTGLQIIDQQSRILLLSSFLYNRSSIYLQPKSLSFFFPFWITSILCANWYIVILQIGEILWLFSHTSSKSPVIYIQYWGFLSRKTVCWYLTLDPNIFP